MNRVPPDWQLPPGVDRGLWAYTHSDELAANYDASLAGTPLLDADLRAAARLFDSPGRLLDLGCGTGRLLMPFAARGFECVGVDISEPMLRRTAEKAEASGVRVALLKANLTDLAGLRDASFDHAACLFSTLGMIRGAEHRGRAVAEMFRVLKPGGRVLLHVHNRLSHLWDASGRAWLWTHGRVGDREMPGPGGVGRLTLHLFTRGEAVRTLRDAGFADVRVEPIGLRADGSLPAAWWLPSLRAYGFLLAARRPS